MYTQLWENYSQSIIYSQTPRSDHLTKATAKLQSLGFCYRFTSTGPSLQWPPKYSSNCKYQPTTVTINHFSQNKSYCMANHPLTTPMTWLLKITWFLKCQMLASLITSPSNCLYFFVIQLTCTCNCYLHVKAIVVIISIVCNFNEWFSSKHPMTLNGCYNRYGQANDEGYYKQGFESFGLQYT